jgi:hypothetical protein
MARLPRIRRLTNRWDSMITDSPSLSLRDVNSHIVGGARRSYSAFEPRPGSYESIDNSANQVTTHS